MAFLAAIDLSELPALEVGLDLPRVGHLLFFHEPREVAWGYRPDHAGAGRVLYIGPSDFTMELTCAAVKSYPHVPLACAITTTVPGPWSPLLSPLGLSADDRFQFAEEQADQIFLQMGGHPQSIQDSPMQVECELIARGFDLGDGWPDLSPTIDEAKAAENWILLFQVPSSIELGTEFADGGSLYFWISRQDLARRDFSRVWMILETF